MSLEQNTPIDALLTSNELAQALKVSVSTVYYWKSRNEIPYIKLGRHLRFKLAEVIAAFEERTSNTKLACIPPHFELNETISRSLKSEDASRASNRKE